MRANKTTEAMPRPASGMLRRAVLPALLLATATLVGGCVYNPYAGGYEPGVVAAPGYGYYAPAYAYAPPTVVIGGGWGHGWGGGHGGYWRH